MMLSSNFVSERVSVIIITYNYGRFISHTLESVLSQNISDMEIIVVDDGSTDNTSQILEKYYPRITYIYQANAGQSAARNTGLRACTGEFIQFLDSDDILEANKISIQVQYMNNHPDAMIAVCPNKLFTKLNSKGRPVVSGEWHLFPKDLDLYLCFFNIAPPHAFLFRRKVFCKIGWFDSEVDNCEDYDILLRSLALGFIPHYISSCKVFYRRHKKSVTTNLFRQYLTDVEMHRKLDTLIDKLHIPQERRTICHIAFAAGTLKTAKRLSTHHPRISTELMQMAHRHLFNAREENKSRKIKWILPLRFFCLTILSFLSLPWFKQHALFKAIQSELNQILYDLNIPVSPLYQLADAFRTAVKSQEFLFFERALIFYLPVKYLLNRYLPTMNRVRFLN
jgi:glycosyltransferase involved in cell wall biosynthesis